MKTSSTHASATERVQSRGQAFWRALSIARVCTWCAALVISVVVAWLLYQQNFLNQVAKFTADFDSLTKELHGELTRLVSRAELTMVAMSRGPFLHAGGGQVYFPWFEDYAVPQSRSLGARSVSILPVVYQGERQAFERFLSLNAPYVNGKATSRLAPQQQADALAALRRGIVVLATRSTGMPLPNGTEEASVETAGPPSESTASPPVRPYYLPYAQSAPLSDSVRGILADSRAAPGRAATLDRAFFARAPVWSGLTLIDWDAVGGAQRVSSHLDVPSIFENATTGESAITGFVSASFSYDDMLTQLVGTGKYFDIVVRDAWSKSIMSNGTDVGSNSSAGPPTFAAFTLRVSGQVVKNIGAGDLHAESATARSHKRSFEVVRGSNSSTLVFDLYPADNYLAAFTDDAPLFSSLAMVAITVGVTAVFFLIDFLSRGYIRTQATLLAMERLQAEMEQDGLQQQRVFAGMVAHVCGAVDLVRTTDLSPEQLTYLSVIEHGAGQILNLVEDLMDTQEGARDEAPSRFRNTPTLCHPKRDIVDLAWMSIRLQKRYASKVKRLQMRLELAEFGIPEAALCDAARARQVLTNVLGNAVKFTPEGGSVTMSVDFLDPEWTLRVRVVDTGIGLSPDGLARLFHPFSQADSDTKEKYGGNGLGLVLSRDICHALGGDLQLSSDGPGLGCVAVATFRLEPAPKQATSGVSSGGARAPSAPRPSTSNSLLMVEHAVKRTSEAFVRAAAHLAPSNAIAAVSSFVVGASGALHLGANGTPRLAHPSSVASNLNGFAPSRTSSNAGGFHPSGAVSVAGRSSAGLGSVGTAYSGAPSGAGGRHSNPLAGRLSPAVSLNTPDSSRSGPPTAWDLPRRVDRVSRDISGGPARRNTIQTGEDRTPGAATGSATLDSSTSVGQMSLRGPLPPAQSLPMGGGGGAFSARAGPGVSSHGSRLQRVSVAVSFAPLDQISRGGSDGWATLMPPTEGSPLGSNSHRGLSGAFGAAPQSSSFGQQPSGGGTASLPFSGAATGGVPPSPFPGAGKGDPLCWGKEASSGGNPSAPEILLPPTPGSILRQSSGDGRPVARGRGGSATTLRTTQEEAADPPVTWGLGPEGPSGASKDATLAGLNLNLGSSALGWTAAVEAGTGSSVAPRRDQRRRSLAAGEEARALVAGALIEDADDVEEFPAAFLRRNDRKSMPHARRRSSVDDSAYSSPSATADDLGADWICSKRIIAAEDDQLCRKMLSMMLKQAGFQNAAMAENGKVASDLVLSDPRNVACIILDSNMGGGDLDGLPALERIMHFYKDIGMTLPPVCILSGEVSNSDMHARFRAAGATEVLVKPASLKKIRDLRSLVASHEAHERATAAAAAAAAE